MLKYRQQPDLEAAEREARQKLREALLIQLYAHEDLMVIHGELLAKNTVRAMKERCKNG